MLFEGILFVCCSAVVADKNNSSIKAYSLFVIMFVLPSLSACLLRFIVAQTCVSFAA